MDKKKNTPLFNRLSDLTTEQRNPASMEIDTKSIPEILAIINAEDKRVAVAVEKEIPYIVKAASLVAEAFKNGGRLIYAGAGTSGRLGVLDAVECPPTYGVSPDMVRGIIAGGDAAMFRAQEGAEDKEDNGANDIQALGVSGRDVVCGIAASLQTPYVSGAVKEARKLNAKTLLLTTNPRRRLAAPDFKDLRKAVDVAICVDVGPEVIMGSTRMKSGTAQKMVLNMITTSAMIRLGKVYENMMIDLQMTNAKLRERAKKILMTITGIDYKAAADYLEKADGHVKTAIVMILGKVDAPTARNRLLKSNGFVRAAAKMPRQTPIPKRRHR